MAGSISLVNNDKKARREFRWSKAARDLVRANINASGRELSAVISRLEDESGYPRWACWKFARRMGIRSKRQQRAWTQSEQKRLEKLLDLHPINQIAMILRRSESSVWHMLYRLGGSAAMGKDGFTKNTLAAALHVSPSQIEGWISRGWLQAREVETGKIKRIIIAAEDFCDFCRKHTRDVVGNRLSKERLDFVYRFAFPPSHAELLPVRESKKERNAYEAQMGEEEVEEASDGFDPESAGAEDDSLDQIA
ncbi:MAG: hypothetical protein ACRD4F_00810 [Candidatus Angelobacter sp.]